jgi:hypothetical protein
MYQFTVPENTLRYMPVRDINGLETWHPKAEHPLWKLVVIRILANPVQHFVNAS